MLYSSFASATDTADDLNSRSCYITLQRRYHVVFWAKRNAWTVVFAGSLGAALRHVA